MHHHRINALARLSKATRYLEVGVCFGETFFEVDIPYKVAVDPHFRFDYAAKAAKKTLFHPVTSDDFFRQTDEKSFDVIYLDGLHTYDQTTRDFFNSFRVSHDKTLWLLDDTVPNDVYSAIPDMETCYRLRRKMGGTDISWMGDVYKTVFAIDRMLPFFNFRTFRGHGQTLIWRDATARDIDPNGWTLDRIGRMTYEEMVDNLDAMRFDTDEAIFATVSAALNR